MIVRITDLDDRNINVEVEDDIDTNYVINKATCQVFAKGTSIVISFWNPRDRNLSATQLVYDESIVEEPIHTDVDDLVAKVNAFLVTGGGGGDPLGYYGSWQDNITQTAVASNTGYAMIFRTEDVTPNGVSIVSNGTNLTRITFDNTGIYNLQFSSQFQNIDNAEHDVTIWLRLNGVDVAGSSGFVQVPKRKSAGAGNEGHCISSWNYLLDVVAGQYYELMWSTTSHTNVTMEFYAAGSPPPSAASVILSVTQQSGIMAGTGITAINSITEAAQTLGVGTSGTDFAISSSGSAHTFNLPTASASNRGALSSVNWSTFNGKQDQITAGTTSQYYRGDKTFQTLNKTAVGLANVDNTSDASKPVSTAQQTALDLIQEVQFNRIGGRYHTPTLLAGALPSVSTVLNNIYLIPFNVTKTTTITDIAINVVTFAAACLGTWGIYSSNAAGEPNALLCTSGSVNIASNGVKNVTLGSPLVLTKGTYWTACWTSVTCSITGNTAAQGGALLNTLGQATVTTTQTTSFIKGSVYGAGTLPNPFGAYTNNNTACPLVYFKIS
jgi:hypothetical protein